MRCRNFSFVIILVAMFFCAMPAQAQQNEDLVDRVSKAVGVRIPSKYEANIRNLSSMQRVIKDQKSCDFIEQFIKDQMKTNWGIKKQDQLLFVWTAICREFKGEYIYDGSDGDDARLEDYLNIEDKFDACSKKFNKEFSAHLQQRSAEADRRSAESQQTIVILTYYELYQDIHFYTLRNAAYESEIEIFKKSFKDNIDKCKELKINYQSLLPLEVQKFYGLNPIGNPQNSITCDKAMVQILNIILKEIVKLYNIYQQAPQAKRDIDDIRHYIDSCKKHNIDYKKELTPEMRKFFGIE